MNALPVAFVAAAFAMVICQVFKIVLPAFRGRPLEFRNAFQSGGMPSAHTAACAAMAFTVGFREGFNSSVFAVAAVLAVVVAHDAVKVRGTMNTMIRLLNRCADPADIEAEGGLPETVGHSAVEVAVGFVLALIIAAACHRLLP